MAMYKTKIIKEFIEKQKKDTICFDFPFKVIYKKVNNPISFIAFFTRVGSIYENEDEKGIAHLIEHCIFRGSSKYPQDISKLINSLGGYTNAYTSYDQTAYYINLPSENLYKALDILWDMIINPLFRQNDLDSERNIIFHEIEMRDDDPVTVLFEETLKKMYKNNPMRHPIIGYTHTLKNITLNHVNCFYSQYKNPKNSFFVVVTDEDPTKVYNSFEELFKKLPENVYNSEQSVLNYDYKDEEICYDRLNLKGNVNKTYLMISFVSPTLEEQYKNIEKAYFISLASYILGGSSYSILNRVIKNDLKIVDAVNFDMYSTNKLPGIIYLTAVTESKNVERVVQEFCKIVKDLKSYIELDYFEICKENFESSAFWNFETSANQGMLIGSNELFKSYLEAYEYIGKIQKIKLNDMLEVFYSYVDLNRFMVSVYEKDE
ncbi:MAG: pitrilysin family protein [bacterium]